MFSFVVCLSRVEISGFFCIHDKNHSFNDFDSLFLGSINLKNKRHGKFNLDYLTWNSLFIVFDSLGIG
jgi:hypothetical protein